MNIAKDSVVSIQYTLTDDENRTLDSSADGGPLVYLHGSGSIIPGLEEALEGKTPGAKLQVTIPPEKAYGTRNESMVQAVPRQQFPNPEQLQAGMAFQVNSPQGPMVLTVVEVRPEQVVVDGNHPLAGVTLHFDVQVEEVRAATPAELEHGHAHGPGGHDH